MKVQTHLPISSSAGAVLSPSLFLCIPLSLYLCFHPSHWKAKPPLSLSLSLSLFLSSSALIFITSPLNPYFSTLPSFPLFHFPQLCLPFLFLFLSSSPVAARRLLPAAVNCRLSGEREREGVRDERGRERTRSRDTGEQWEVQTRTHTASVSLNEYCAHSACLSPPPSFSFPLPPSFSLSTRHPSSTPLSLCPPSLSPPPAPSLSAFKHVHTPRLTL